MPSLPCASRVPPAPASPAPGSRRGAVARAQSLAQLLADGVDAVAGVVPLPADHGNRGQQRQQHRHAPVARRRLALVAAARFFRLRSRYRLGGGLGEIGIAFVHGHRMQNADFTL